MPMRLDTACMRTCCRQCLPAITLQVVKRSWLTLPKETAPTRITLERNSKQSTALTLLSILQPWNLTVDCSYVPANWPCAALSSWLPVHRRSHPKDRLQLHQPSPSVLQTNCELSCSPPAPDNKLAFPPYAINSLQHRECPLDPKHCR
jgi:hypothetical protein